VSGAASHQDDKEARKYRSLCTRVGATGLLVCWVGLGIVRRSSLVAPTLIGVDSCFSAQPASKQDAESAVGEPWNWQ